MEFEVILGDISALGFSMRRYEDLPLEISRSDHEPNHSTANQRLKYGSSGRRSLTTTTSTYQQEDENEANGKSSRVFINALKSNFIGGGTAYGLDNQLSQGI